MTKTLPHVGETVDTNYGSKGLVAAVSEDGERVLLIISTTGRPCYVGAWNMQQAEDGKWFWAQGHYFGDDYRAAFEYMNM